MDEFLIYGEPVKGWALIRAMKDVANMRAGEWGLAFSNLFFTKKDFLPSFVFKDIPNDTTDEDVFDNFDCYLKKIEKFEKQMMVDPQIGFAFYNSCMIDGFDPTVDDFHIFVAERILGTAYDGQKQLSEEQMKTLMEIFVYKEEYEKAALVRDKLDNKTISRIF
jgi:hypothetical protein